jgi:aminoglycoside 3-N-acetyltransferase I
MKVIKLKGNEAEDFRSLIEIFTEVFETRIEIPDNDYLGKLLLNPDFLVFVIKVNEQIIGGLTAYVLHQYYSKQPLAYIYDVGIAPSFQGKGYGKILIAEFCDYCKSNRFEEAYVEAENDDTDAISFYRKTKFDNEIMARHFTYSFN